MKKCTLELLGMKFHSFHGCFEKEKTEGNSFVVDFKAAYDMTGAAISDNLDDAVNYGSIYSIVAEQMQKRSNLLENVAWRIADAVSAAFPQLEDIEVSVSKKNPPVGGDVEWSRITVRL